MDISSRLARQSGPSGTYSYASCIWYMSTAPSIVLLLVSLEHNATRYPRYGCSEVSFGCIQAGGAEGFVTADADLCGAARDVPG
jgi:hypothetical protein